MSASLKDAQPLPSSQHDGQNVQKSSAPAGNYKGFVAGVFSGISKLSGMCFLNTSFNIANRSRSRPSV